MFVVLTVCLVLGHLSRSLTGAALVFSGFGQALKPRLNARRRCDPGIDEGVRGAALAMTRGAKLLLALVSGPRLLRLACRGAFRGRLRLRHDSAARPFEPE